MRIGRYSTVAESAPIVVFGKLMLLGGIGVLLFAIALTVRAYMPCAWADEWGVIADIAQNGGHWSWAWLWSQHSEHRIAIPRLGLWDLCYLVDERASRCRAEQGRVSRPLRVCGCCERQVERDHLRRFVIPHGLWSGSRGGERARFENVPAEPCRAGPHV
jgi:hypothetical protein